jgi:hypothetical protein
MQYFAVVAERGGREFGSSEIDAGNWHGRRRCGA